MKKILIIIALFFGLIFSVNANSCVIDESAGSNISGFLNNCKPTKLVGTTKKYDLNTLKSETIKIFGNISTVVGIIAVLMIVIAGLMMQFSGGDDGKIKKAKDIIKWTLIGIFIIGMAGTIVFVVINFIFSLSGS